MSEFYSAHRYRRFYKGYTQFFKRTEVQAYTMVALSLFTISFFGAFAIRPTLKTIALLKRQISDRIEVNQKLEEKINALISAQEEYKRVEKDLPYIYSLLPEKAEFPLLLRQLEILTLSSNATISSIQFDPIILYAKTDSAPPVSPVTGTSGQNQSAQVPEKPLPPLPNEEIATTPVFFSLTITGSYQNLVTLLDQLTKLDRLITISSVDLNGNSTSQEVSTLNVDIQSQAQYFPSI